MAGLEEDKQFRDKLRRAIQIGDVAAAKRLIKGGVNIRRLFWFDSSLLHEAVWTGDDQLVQMLLRQAPAVDAPNKEGRTALHIACRLGSTQIVNQLVQHKASVNATTKDGRSPLHIACWRGHSGIARDLVQAGAKVNCQDEDGWTPLHWAAKLNLQSTVSLLIQHQVKINIRDKHGRIPLHECVANHHMNIARTLLLHGGDSNIQPKGDTTLGLVLRHKDCSVESVKMLFDNGYMVKNEDCQSKAGTSWPSTKDSDIQAVLRQHQATVLDLAHLTRLRIRQCLSRSRGGRPILQTIRKLPIPTLLMDYVSFSDLLKPP